MLYDEINVFFVSNALKYTVVLRLIAHPFAQVW